MARSQLPPRRQLISQDIPIELSLGQYVDAHISFGFNDGQIKEIFYDGGFKAGSFMEKALKDACRLISFMLQSGIDFEDIAKFMVGSDNTDHNIYDDVIEADQSFLGEGETPSIFVVFLTAARDALHPIQLDQYIPASAYETALNQAAGK